MLFGAPQHCRFPFLPSRKRQNFTMDDKLKEAGTTEHLEISPGSPAPGPSSHVDRAAQVVADGAPVDVSIEDDRRVLRKIDKWVMLPMMVIYFLRTWSFRSATGSAVADSAPVQNNLTRVRCRTRVFLGS